MSNLRLPKDSHRLSIVGRTGSGKTQAGVWHLSLRSWDTMPWVVYDFKGDDLINSIEGARHIDTSEVPKQPGLYIIHAMPGETEAVTRQLWQIWSNENTGIYIDEGYMICSSRDPNPAFRTILQQGRSKHVPVIILSQKPAWLDTFVWSESEFFQVFALQTQTDRDRVSEFIPYDPDARLPEYHSWWYDVAGDSVKILKPVPTKEELLKRFDARMKKTSRLFFI